MASFDGTRVAAPDTPDAAPLDVHNLSGMDFFAGAPRPIEDDQLGQLAQSLGAFSSDVRQFGRYYEMNQRVHNTGQGKADMDSVQNLVASKTPEEWGQMVKDGNLPNYSSPMAQLFRDRTTGQYAAHALGVQLQSKLATGELKANDGSAQTWLQQQCQQLIQQNGWDANSGQMRGFGDAYNQLDQNLSGKVAMAQAQDQNEATTNAAQQQIEMAVDGAFRQKMPPDQFWAVMNNTRGFIQQGGHFEPKELDPMFFDALNRRMAQDPNLVMAYGNASRLDMDGKTPIPSLFSKGSTLSQVAAMQQRTQTFNINAAEQQQQASINSGVAQMLRSDPQALANVPEQIPFTNPVSGGTGNVAKSGAVAAAATAIIDQDNRRIAAGTATPDQVQDEQLRTFAMAGIKQHQWADQLNSVANGAGGAVNLSDPKTAGAALGAYSLYASLRTKNPGYLDTLMDGQAKRFFNTAYIQQTLFGRDPSAAMQASASIWSSPKTPEESQSLAAERQDLASTAASMNFGGWALKDVKNPEIARNSLVDAAWSMVKLNGMDPKTAVTAAAPIVQSAFVNVNGQLVPDMHYLPRETMQPAAEKYLTDWATGPAAALRLDPKSLSIQPNGAGKYLIVDASSGQPVMSSRGFSYVTPKDLITSAQGLAKVQQDTFDKEADQAAEVARAQPQFRQGVTPQVIFGGNAMKSYGPTIENRRASQEDEDDRQAAAARQQRENEEQRRLDAEAAVVRNNSRPGGR